MTDSISTLDWLGGTEEEWERRHVFIGVWSDQNNSFYGIWPGVKRCMLSVYKLHQDGKSRETLDLIDIGQDVLIMGSGDDSFTGVFEK